MVQKVTVSGPEIVDVQRNKMKSRERDVFQIPDTMIGPEVQMYTRGALLTPRREL